MAIVLEKSGDKHRINFDKETSFSGEIKINHSDCDKYYSWGFI